MDIAARVRHLWEFCIYESDRLGQFGRPFKMYKLRTMVRDAPEQLEQVVHEHGRDARGKIINDPRFTRYGKLLKRHRIDELPQLLNILKGEMAVMGPRAHSQPFYDEFIPQDLHERRQQVRPGWLKPMMAYDDYDEGGLEFETERRYLDELAERPVRTQLLYIVRAIMPHGLKWKLHPGGRMYRGEFWEGRYPH